MKYNIIFILFVLIVSCNGQKKMISENNSDGQLNQAKSTMVLLLQEEYSGFDITETLVIKDEKRLRSFYTKLNRVRKPRLPVPQVNFEKEMVIIHCSGEQNISGLSTLSMSKETKTEILLVSKRDLVTSKSKGAVTTYPFCVYKMSLSTKDVVVEPMADNYK